MPQLEWRGRQAKQPAESPLKKRLETASCLDVLILKSVDFVNNDQRKQGPVGHERATRQIVEDARERHFVGSGHCRCRTVRELGMVLEYPKECPLQVREMQRRNQTSQLCIAKDKAFH